MPRVIGRAKAASAKSSKQSASDNASTALQPKSTNPLKRPLSNVSSEKGDADSEEMPNPKRVATSPSFRSVWMNPARGIWDVQGVYKITSVSAMEDVETSNFSLKLFHYNRGRDQQIYAVFAFDKLEGIMRICPHEAMKSKPLGQFYLADFEKACTLQAGSEPGPRNDAWVMKWRARDGGMRLGQLVGGEVDINNPFKFEKDENCMSGEFLGLKITFNMEYNYNLFKVQAIKVRNLETEAAVAPGALDTKWKSLRDPTWEMPEHDSGDEEVLEGDGPILSAADLMRAKQQETSLPSIEPVLVPNGRGGFKKCIELPPAWAWDVTGQWKIDTSHPAMTETMDLEENTTASMTVHVANNPLHTKIGRQLWATFMFGSKLYGTIRFCPLLTPPKLAPRELKDFEAVCVLQRGHWPGPSPEGKEEWSMRWRGRRNSSGLAESSDSHQSQVRFKRGEDGKLLMQGVIVYQSQPLVLNAEKVSDAPPPKGNETTVTTHWDSNKRPSQTNRGGWSIFST